MSQLKARRHLPYLFTTAALLGIGYGLAHVQADGAPKAQPLWYAGTVADQAGTPLDGSHKVSLRLFAAPSGGSAVCVVDPIDAAFQKGRFRLNAESCGERVRATPDLFAELTVDDASKPFPRTKIGAVPYALEADHALNASNALMATQAASANAAGGALKTAIDGLAARSNPPVITGWTSYVPTVTSANGTTAPASSKGSWRRVGDTVEVNIYTNFTAVCTGTGQLRWSLPPEIAPDRAKLTGLYPVAGTGLSYSGSLVAGLVISPSVGSTVAADQYGVIGGGIGCSATSSTAEVRMSFALPVSGWTVTGP